MSDTPKPDTAAIRARADAATPGPWTLFDHGIWHNTDNDSPAFGITSFLVDENNPLAGGGDLFTVDGCEQATAADFRFVSAARADVPALCDALDVATARIAELEATIARARRPHTTYQASGGVSYCRACAVRYPCPAMKALDGEAS